MDERLRNRLRLWRVGQGLTLREEADLTGFSESMLSRAERGERVFSPMAKVKIARALDVRIADLFEPDDLDVASSEENARVGRVVAE